MPTTGRERFFLGSLPRHARGRAPGSSASRGKWEMFLSTVLSAVLALVIFWAVGAYQRLVRLRSAAVQAFARLDTHLVRTLALLGEYDAAQATAGAPDLAARQALRATATECSTWLAAARSHPLHPDAALKLGAALQALDVAWGVLVQQIPLLATPQGATPWALRWEQQQTDNAQARTQFGMTVTQYNAAIAQFPAQVLAWLWGFHAARVL